MKILLFMGRPWSIQPKDLDLLSFSGFLAQSSILNIYYRKDSSHDGHLSVVKHLVNMKADINTKTIGFEFYYLFGLLFIMLLKTVI